MDFKRLEITDWQQFKKIDISCHNRITILTGANASGKTTILNLLAKHCGWEAHSLATPTKDMVSKVWKWLTGFISQDTQSRNVVGTLVYSDNSEASLKVPIEQNDAQYDIQIDGQKSVKCFFIPSHRSVFRYQKVTQIPVAAIVNNKQSAFDKVWSSNKSRYSGGGSDHPSNFHIKEALISWSIFGQGNQDMEPNDTLLEYYNGFQEVLKKILPKTLGFERFIIKNSEVVLECRSGNFLIDGSSGGISALIDLAWQIYFYTTEENPEFTVLIDEVENHLHPTMQRQILPDLLNAFPNTRFIVSTHNPLTVGSVKDSNIYALRYNDQNKIVSEQLDFLTKAKTASEILDEVLGVSFTMPIWVEEKLNEIVKEYTQGTMTKDQFAKMRARLKDEGLENIMPELVANLIEVKTNDQN